MWQTDRVFQYFRYLWFELTLVWYCSSARGKVQVCMANRHGVSVFQVLVTKLLHSNIVSGNWKGEEMLMMYAHLQTLNDDDESLHVYLNIPSN